MKEISRILAAILLGAIFALGWAVDYPLSVTDDLGRQVTIEAEPQRVISLLPSHTETLCDLDACGKLVGVDDFSNYPPQVEELPDLGGLHNASIESIVSLEPDLVLLSENGELAQALSRLGVTVYAGSAQTYEELLDKFLLLGRLVNREDAAEALANRVQSEVEEVERLTTLLPAPSVYYEIDSTPYSVGPNSFIGVLITKAGAENIVDEGMGDFPRLDPEFIVDSAPELIVLGDAPYGESIETLRQRPGWQTIPAVAEERVHELTQEQVDILSRPGPRVAEGVRLLARLFHPGLF
ncbi:MAG: ABC transporter substrate-binding protein [Trueperaceae bacterium]